MTPGNNEINYKKLFRKNEEAIDIPEFDDILNLPSRQKKSSSRLVSVIALLILCAAVTSGIYFSLNKSHKAGYSKNETLLFKDKKPLVWEWKSPTQQLLSASLSNSFTNLNMPTDCLSPKETILQINHSKKTN